MPLPASVDELTRLSADLAEYNAKGSKAKMWKAIFEPDELANFVDLTDMMQMVGRIQTQGGSDTFGNFAMEQNKLLLVLEESPLPLLIFLQEYLAEGFKTY